MILIRMWIYSNSLNICVSEAEKAGKRTISGDKYRHTLNFSFNDSRHIWSRAQ